MARRSVGVRTGAWISLVLLSLAFPASSRGATAQQVDDSVKKAKEYLYAHQNNGNWETVPAMQAGKDWGSIEGDQWGGLTALNTYALLAAGDPPSEPHVAAALTWLQTAQMKGNYALGVRCLVWHAANGHDRKYIKELKRDGEQLLAFLKVKGPGKGMWNYEPDNNGMGDWTFDHSGSQYGILGMWACADAGIEIPDEKWKMVDAAWREQQNPDGGWAYRYKIGEPQASVATMTAAGVASLFITQDALFGDRGIECKGNLKNDNIDKGLTWMQGNFPTIYDGVWKYYGLYGISRIGIASGYKYFGTTDWYQAGSDHFVTTQSPDGSWPNHPWESAFGILFLSRGRAPVVINKLEYSYDAHGDKPKPANWNQRPRDAANITTFIGQQLERDMNWQIVNLTVAPEELHDAPILYISGNQPLEIGDDAEAKLRLFVQQGGLIVGNPDCSSVPFVDSFKKLGKKLFPDYEFRDVATDDIIYKQQFARDKWKNKPALSTLNNGARHLMLITPFYDPARYWQTRTYKGREESHELLADIYLYAIDRQSMRNKGESYLVAVDKAVTPTNTLKVARIQYGGNWDPEPGGWARMAAVLNNRYATAITTTPVKLGAGKLTSDYKIADLTGTAAFTLDATARAELKKFVEGGGTLIVDAAGGNAAFGKSAETELKAIFNSDIVGVTPLAADAPVYLAGGKKLEDVTYRSFARKTAMGETKSPRVKAIEINKRPAVFYSAEDLAVGMVGEPVDGIYGYDPKTATQIMADLLLFASAGGAPVAEVKSNAFPRQVVWDGDTAQGGGSWTDPKTATVKLETTDAAHGKGAMEFHSDGAASSSMGWNWFKWWPADGGTDASAFTNLSFMMKYQGAAMPSKVCVRLNCSTQQPSNLVDISKYAPVATDGKWHEVVVPLKDLTDGTQFNAKKAWEFHIIVNTDPPAPFSVFVDDIGFDSRGK